MGSGDSVRLLLRPVIDLATFVGDRPVVTTGVGDADRLVALLGSVTPGARVDQSEPFIPGGEHDPRVAVTAALFADWLSRSVIELPIEPLTLAYPAVQPLADGGLLVADTRVAVGKPPNGYVIGPNGKVRRSIMFGDGIEHMLVDRLSPSTPPASTPISELEELFSVTRSMVLPGPRARSHQDRINGHGRYLALPVTLGTTGQQEPAAAPARR